MTGCFCTSLRQAASLHRRPVDSFCKLPVRFSWSDRSLSLRVAVALTPVVNEPLGHASMASAQPPLQRTASSHLYVLLFWPQYVESGVSNRMEDRRRRLFWHGMLLFVL